MGWLDEHIEGFVIPHLESEGNTISTVEWHRKALSSLYEPLNVFATEELTVIKNTWRSVKRAAKGKTVLLAGRDVFIFEVLARREGYPTHFVPECSRMTVRHLKIPNVEDYFLFDTGFIGSIPKGLGITDFSLMSYSSNSVFDGWGIYRQHKTNPLTIQVFPRLTFSRGLALKIEQTPKYWESGRVVADDEIVQPMSRLQEFINAARLTVEIYKNSAPKFIPKHKPITIERGW